MKSNFFLGLIVLGLVSCKKSPTLDTAESIKISQNLSYEDAQSYLKVNSGNLSFQIPKSKLPLKKVILLNATMVGFMASLDLEQQIVGITSPEYIYSKRIHQLLDKGTIKVVGNDQKYDIEQILALKPDAIITNHIPNFQNTYDILKKNGIAVIFLNEYTEPTPLEKSAYIKFFGRLFGVEEKANAIYQEIETHYQDLKQMAEHQSEQPYVLSNEMYGNQWFIPGNSTFVAQYYKDAGSRYVFSDLNSNKAEPLSFEEVYAKAEPAQYWVNLSNHSAKKELLMVNPAYAKMKVFNNGQLYGFAKRTRGAANDYFESGVVRADWVLRDYIKIFHPQLLPNDTLVYMNHLK